MSRTAADSALLLDVIAGFDARDPWALAASAQSCLSALNLGVAGLRVAASPTLGYVDVHPEVALAFEAAVRVFTELGAKVEHVDPGFADPGPDFEVLWFSGAAKVAEPFGPEQRERMDPGLIEVCEVGARFSALEYLGAMAARNVLGARMSAFHTRYDLLLTPTLPLPAFEVGREVPAGSASPRWTSWTPFTYPFNMTQQPATSVPCGFTSDGLPVGLQVIGARHDDARVLAAAHAYQQATDWHLRRPTLLT
jgi:aspartyl-tRNA(Asn)/glutamyl-tRNA(Gln) amidotransferase subunit A